MKTLADYNLKGGERLCFLASRTDEEIKRIVDIGYIRAEEVDNNEIRIVSIEKDSDGKIIYFLLNIYGMPCNNFTNPEHMKMEKYVIIRDMCPKKMLIDKILHK